MSTEPRPSGASQPSPAWPAPEWPPPTPQTPPVTAQQYPPGPAQSAQPPAPEPAPFPQPWPQQSPTPGMPPTPGRSKPRTPEGDKSYLVTLMLSYFVGVFGVDRFYLGKIPSGLVKLFTFGGFGYWWFIDILITLFGGQRDAQGLRLAGYDRYKKAIWLVLAAIVGGVFALSVIAAVVTATLQSAGSGGVWVLLAVLAVCGVVVWATVASRRRSPAIQADGEGRRDVTPSHVRAVTTHIAGLRAAYVAYAAAGDEIAAALVPRLDALNADTAELFARLAAKADKAERHRAEAEYVDKLGKLANALDHDYLLDVLANPRLWDDPRHRAEDVLHAVEAVDAQLLDNIRQVNAHRGLVFQVAVDDLVGPRKAMDDWQRDFDRADGDSR